MVGDVRLEPDYRATQVTEEVRSELCAPLLLRRATRGARSTSRAATLDAFDEDDAQAGRHDRRTGERRAALGAAVRAARVRLPEHGRGAGRRARGEGLVHGKPLALDRRARGGRRSGARDGRRRAANTALRGRVPRHRQAGDPGVDPQQDRPVDRRGARPDRTAHGDRRADPGPDRLPRGRAPDRAPRARALGRRWISRRPRPGRRSRSARGSSSPATPTTR